MEAPRGSSTVLQDTVGAIGMWGGRKTSRKNSSRKTETAAELQTLTDTGGSRLSSLGVKGGSGAAAGDRLFRGGNNL